MGKARQGASTNLRLARTGCRSLCACALLALVLLAPLRGHAQSNVRLLLSSGMGVPEHSGFAFGTFSGLTMNAQRQLAFLTTLRSPRTDIPAVVRSSGVSFSVVAFQGLRAPVARAMYDSFSAPSINDAGMLAFTAALRDHEESPTAAVIRMVGPNATAVVTSFDEVPGAPGAKFLEFSAPLIDSQGNILFGARWGGKPGGSGMFRWTPAGLHNLVLPAGLTLSPKDLLVPLFFSHDEAMFGTRGTPAEAALEQFFRAVAIRTFQELTPPPSPEETVQILAPQAGEMPVQMLLVFTEGGNVQTVLLTGDPTQPVLAKHLAGAPDVKPLGRIEGQTTGEQGNIIFAATLADQPNDLALYCYCDSQEVRETTQDEFLPITAVAPGKPILSLASDARKTVAFVVPGLTADVSSIYVAALP
jgi:hypothetical protein